MGRHTRATGNTSGCEATALVPLETLEIKYDPDTPHAANARAIACIAYPPGGKKFWGGKSPRDWVEGQQAFSFALLWAWSQTKLRDDPDWRWQARPPVPPIVFSIRNVEDMWEFLTHGMNALRSRYFASEIGRALHNKHGLASFGIEMELDGVPVSVNSLAYRTARLKRPQVIEASKNAQKSAIANVRQRDWVATWPMLHFAMEFFWHMRGQLRTTEVQEVVQLVEGEWLPNVVAKAEATRTTIANSPAFAGIREQDLVRISIV